MPLSSFGAPGLIQRMHEILLRRTVAESDVFASGEKPMKISNALWCAVLVGGAVLGGYLIFHGFDAAGKAGLLEALFSRELYHPN